MVDAAVFGARGYLGRGLVAILDDHPAVDELSPVSSTHAGQPYADAVPSLGHLGHLGFSSPGDRAVETADVVDHATRLATGSGGSVALTHDPHEAAMGAEAIATDTWISMGDEEEAEERKAAFEGYTVDGTLMDHAAPGCVFLHCLPGHWGHEATYEVAHGPDSVILDEAENRLWTQMALMGYLVG